MANISDGTFASGRQVTTFVGSIARTDTAAKVLFTLPPNAILSRLVISGNAVSNAGTTATLSVGYQGGSQTALVNALDVKGATGSGQQFPVGGGQLGSGLTGGVVTGIYAETGGASNAGGPWNVIADVITV